MQAVCPGSGASVTDNTIIESFEPLEDVKEAVKAIDSLNGLSSYYMCSLVCPCLKPAGSVISGWTEAQDWFKIEETKLLAFERTW